MPQKPFFRKHDGWWVVQLRQGNKRWQHKLIKGTPPKGKDTEQEAYRLFSQLMAEGSDQLPAPAKIRMAEVLKAFLEHSAATHKPSTFAWYKNFLVSFDDLYGALRPHQVTPAIVEAWLKTEEGWKGSRRGAIIAIKGALNWAYENKKIVSHPLHGLKPPPVKCRERFLTPEERRRIFDSYPLGDPFRDFLFALDQTGCRPGEVANVTAADVDLRTGVWDLTEHKTRGKTGQKRPVILTPAMVQLTEKLMRAYPEGTLFRNENGKPWVRNSIRCRFRRVREKLNLGKDVVAYLYRHAVCTDLLEAGVGLAQTCEILGHKTTDMVMRHYSKIRNRREHLREQILKARGTPDAA
jgi:integrase